MSTRASKRERAWSRRTHAPLASRSVASANDGGAWMWRLRQEMRLLQCDENPIGVTFKRLTMDWREIEAVVSVENLRTYQSKACD
jgi:hypothetical protein